VLVGALRRDVLQLVERRDRLGHAREAQLAARERRLVEQGAHVEVQVRRGRGIGREAQRAALAGLQHETLGGEARVASVEAPADGERRSRRHLNHRAARSVRRGHERRAQRLIAIQHRRVPRPRERPRRRVDLDLGGAASIDRDLQLGRALEVEDELALARLVPCEDAAVERAAAGAVTHTHDPRCGSKSSANRRSASEVVLGNGGGARTSCRGCPSLRDTRVAPRCQRSSTRAPGIGAPSSARPRKRCAGAAGARTVGGRARSRGASSTSRNSTWTAGAGYRLGREAPARAAGRA
jgi:hypothetical protein